MKYIAYYRTSKEGKGRAGLGLDAQRQIVEHFYEIKEEFIEVKSAKTITDRPILQQALKRCHETGFSLVVAKVDRLSRDVDDCRLILKQLNGRLFACDIPGILDKFTLTLYATFAERERELISLRTSQALQAKIKRDGHWNKGSSIFNTKEFRAKGTKALKAKAANNPNNQRAQSLIKEMKAKGSTLAQIAEELNKNSFKTSRGYDFTTEQVRRLV